jgi:hypothetical protein
MPMDEHQKRQILQKAYAAVDSDRREADAWEHRQWLEMHRDRYGILDLGEDREIEQPRQQQPSSDEMVFKTFHNDTPAQQRSATMDAQTQAAWNEWLRVNVEDALDNYTLQVVKHVAEVITQERREMRREMRKHVAKELRELRDEIEILRSVVKAENVELIKRGSNVA